MEDLSRRKAIKGILGTALIAATSASIISCKSESKNIIDSNSIVTKAQNGQELRLTREGKKILVETISNGKIADSSPTGTFTLGDGKSIIVEKGEIIGGESMANGKFGAFALLRQD